MSLDIISSLAQKLQKHCVDNGTKELYLAFHGGEPLLASKSFYKEAIAIFNSTLNGIDVTYVVQTNGTLLDDEWCYLCKELNIQIGISIDGPEQFRKSI
jgi:uncharacterized protein